MKKKILYFSLNLLKLKQSQEWLARATLKTKDEKWKLLCVYYGVKRGKP